MFGVGNAGLSLSKEIMLRCCRGAPSAFSASGADLGDGAPSTCGNGLESLNHIPVMSIFLVPRIKVFLCF